MTVRRGDGTDVRHLGRTDRCARRALELERGVLDGPVLGEHRLHRHAELLRVGERRIAIHHDVRREGAQTTLMLANLDAIKAGDGSTDYPLRKGDLVVVPSAYPVVAGYEIRKALYPLEVLMRTIGSGLFLAFASGG